MRWCEPRPRPPPASGPAHALLYNSIVLSPAVRQVTARSGGTARALVSKGHVTADKQVRKETLLQTNKYRKKPQICHEEFFDLLRRRRGAHAPEEGLQQG